MIKERKFGNIYQQGSSAYDCRIFRHGRWPELKPDTSVWMSKTTNSCNTLVEFLNFGSFYVCCSWRGFRSGSSCLARDTARSGGL